MKRIALTLALVASLILPGAAFAATEQSSAETLTVNFTISIDGVPAATAYGAANAGSTVFGPAMTITMDTNAAAGLTLTYAGSDFTTPGGTISKSNRISNLDNLTEKNGGDWTKDYGTGSSTLLLTPSVMIPAGAPGGNYTGTMTLSVAVK